MQHPSRVIAYSTSPNSLPGRDSPKSKWNVLTCCIPTEVIVAREAALIAIVSAKIRASPTSSNPVADERTRPLAGQALAPVPTKQSVPEFSLPCYRALVGPLRWFEDPPADERPVDEPGQEA
jgi:hypothetical protein